MWVYCSDISHLQTPICTENQPFLESLFPTHGRGVMEGWYPLVSPLKWLVWRKTSSRNLYDFPIWWLYQHWLVGYNQKKNQCGDNFSWIPWTPTQMKPHPPKKRAKRLDSRLLVLSGQQILQAARCYHSHWKLLKRTWENPPTLSSKNRKNIMFTRFLWQNLYVCDRSNFILVWW